MPDSQSHWTIANLIATYARLVDAGDFRGVGTLMSGASFAGSGTPIHGRAAIEKMLTDTVIRYEDGTPRTKHVTTNLAIEIDEDDATAVARSYFTVLQALPDLPLQTIASGRYTDHFHRRDETWTFTARRVHLDLIGDVTRHLRRPSTPEDTLDPAPG